MSRLDELISELCPDGVEYKKLEDIATDIFRGAGIKRDEVTENGISCVRYGEIYTTYGIWFDKCVSHTQLTFVKSPKYFEYGDVLFAITGESVEDIAKSTVYVGNEKCLAGGDIVVLKHKQNPKYISYALATTDARKQKSAGKVKSKVVHSSVPAIKQIVIPVPPLEVQSEIVRILDNFTELTARKQQYEYYFHEIMNMYDSPIVKLGDIGQVKMCKRIMKAQTSSKGEIPFFKIGTFGKEADAYMSRELFEEYVSKYPYPTKGDILISCSGTIGRTVVFDGEPAYFQDSNIVWLEHDGTKVSNEYLRFAYMTNPWIISTGGTISRLYNDGILKAEIPLPSLEEQKSIVALLSRFDAICNDISSGLPAEIEARQRQYEYYRDKLLTFKQLA